MTEHRTERLHKVMAAAGVASRRACEDLIAAGRVTVDGAVAELGAKIDPASAEVRLDGERVNLDLQRQYLMLNKPRGVITTADDPAGRPTVLEMVDVPERVFPVGRLDMDSEGLLLLTNDGDLAHALTHPSYGVPRTYLVLVPGPVRRQHLERLRAGVELDDGFARPEEIEVIDTARSRALVRVVLTEGRTREVRRLFDAIGLQVERLARVAYDGVELGDLRQGNWRPLDQREIGRLYRAVERQP